MPEFPCPAPITADVRLSGGTLDIHAEPRDTAVVDVAPFDDSDAAREAAANTRVELSGDTLVIHAPESGGWAIRWRTARLRVTARVPADSHGRIKVASADTTCHGVWSQIKLNTASGDAYIEHVTGDLSVNSASGDIRTVHVDGRLTVNSASGTVSAQRVDGSVDIKSASGDVELEEVGADLRANTASGDVRVAAARTGTVKVNSASGDISVGVVPGTGVWLDLNSLSGRTHSDLNHGGDAPANGQDLTVQVRTMSGDINVHRA